MMYRIEALDSVRGIAAAAAVIGHSILATGSPSIPVHWAVMLFFVLSGFVLSVPWIHGRPPRLIDFMVRRVLRLWPPIVVTVLASAALFKLIGSHAPYWGLSWREPVTIDLMTRCLFLTGQHSGCNALDIPLWSLVYEARISLLFPVLVALTLRVRPGILCLAQLIGSAVELLFWMEGREAWLPQTPDGLLQGGIATSHYALLFAMGIVLAAHSERIFAVVGRRTGAWLAAAIVLMALPSDSANGFGAALLIATVVSSGTRSRFLRWPPLRWLGRVSYSLYLIHWPLLLAVFYWFGGPLAPSGLALVLIASGLAADLMYRTVERPSIRLGHRLTHRSARVMAVPTRCKAPSMPAP
jgi:peptidoglycan/LPS O-acetylase OafA/YrhL